MESILSEYTGLINRASEIFHKDAYDTWNITMFLLAGGLKNHIMQ